MTVAARATHRRAGEHGRSVAGMLALRRGLAGFLLAVALAPPAASAASADGLSARALALLSIPYGDFLAAKRADPAPPFDWSTDGCSHTPRAWARVFDGPCQQHDYHESPTYLVHEPGWRRAVTNGAHETPPG